MALEVVILAAGKGTRMRSSLPKVLQPLADKPLLAHVIASAKNAGAKNVHVVVGFGSDLVEQAFTDTAGINWVHQTEQLGTGHAVAQALPAIEKGSQVLVLYGDVPLIKTRTMTAMLAGVSDNSMALLTAVVEDPSGLGRIIRNEMGEINQIVEHKDATDQQLAMSEINTGIMAASAEQFNRWLPQLSNNNNSGEYYLTDVIAMAAVEKVAVNGYQASSAAEVQGVNDKIQLAELEREYQRLKVQQLQIAGVTLRDPARVDVRGNLTAGSDVSIDINAVFEGSVTLGNGVSIGPNCVISDSNIGDNVVIKANTVVEQAEIASDCAVGPFARIRPGTQMANGVKVGNFVETKKVQLGAGSKVSHLTYLGDANIGEEVNIGAGTITCNYDGVNKFQTEIGDGAFIGSNSSLVAPVSIGKNATVGAGSTISRDVDDKQLAVARGKQRNLDDWQRPTKQDK